MKKKLVVILVLLSAAAILGGIFFTYKSSELVRKYDENGINGEVRVRLNDVIKTAQDYLETGEVGKLLSVLKTYKYSLKLVDKNEISFFYNNRITKMPIDNQDINSILDGGTKNSRVYILNTAKSRNNNKVIAVINTNIKVLSADELRDSLMQYIWIFCIAFILFGALIYIIINHSIFLPFKRLEKFASEVAKGNLELPLKIENGNFFGAFTWAFDMLREELRSSRKREMQLEKSKKELVAALSHDIRTPIAAIRAYGECLDSLPDKNTDRAKQYIKVIIEKSDELSKLSHDMFLHAISDLEKLEFNCIEVDSRQLLTKLLEPIMLQFESTIMIKSQFPEGKILVDPLRVSQVFENIIGNAVKYAPKSNIEINAYIENDMLHCTFRDFGNGANAEDIPFLFEKFYRGKNAKESGIQGSGIGLYISKYILDKMSGSIRAVNLDEQLGRGFLVDVGFKLIN